jgi:hypothetical protein
VSSEKEGVDYNKFNGYLKMPGFINNHVLTTENFKQKKNKFVQYAGPSSLVIQQ